MDLMTNWMSIRYRCMFRTMTMPFVSDSSLHHERGSTKIDQWFPKWKHYFLHSAGRIVECPLCSNQEGKENKHSYGQDSASESQGFEGICDKAQTRGYLIWNLQARVAYTASSTACSQGDSSFSLLKTRLPLWRMHWEGLKILFKQ